MSELCIHPKTALPVCPDHHVALTLCQIRGCHSAAECVVQCGTDFVPHPQSEFLQPLRFYLQQDSTRITYLKCSWPSWLRGSCAFKIVTQKLLQVTSVPSPEDFQEGLSKVQTLTFLFALIHFFFSPESFTGGIAQERTLQSA